MTGDKHNVRRNVRFAVAEFLVNIGLVFITYRLVIFGGGIEALGLWATLYAWTSIIRVGDIGMANAVLRFVALNDPDSNRATTTAYVETGILANAAFFCLLAMIGYFLCAPWVGSAVGKQHIAEATSVLPVMFTGFFLFNVSGVVLGAVQGLHLGYVRSIISVLSGLMQLGAALILVPSLGLAGLAWAQIAQHCVAITLGWLVIRHRLQRRNLAPSAFDVPAFRAMLHFGLTSQGANILNGLFEPLSKIIVFHFGGLAVQAIYELAFKTLWLPRNAVVAATTATVPAMTARLAHDRAGVVATYRQSVKFTTRSVAGLSTLAVVCTPVISILWIGHLAWEYLIYSAILAGGITLNAYGAAAYNIGTVTGKVRWNLVANGLTLATLLAIGGLAGVWLSVPWVIAAVSFAMAFGGVAIKTLNERLLYQ